MSPTERTEKLALPTIRVLLTEDVATDAELEVRELKRAGMRVAHRIVDSEQSFSAALRDFSPDVILSDFSMPAFDGMWPRWRQALGTAAKRGALCFGPNRGRKVTYTSPRRWLPCSSSCNYGPAARSRGGG